MTFNEETTNENNQEETINESEETAAEEAVEETPETEETPEETPETEEALSKEAVAEEETPEVEEAPTALADLPKEDQLALFDGDEKKIKAVWESQYSLDDIIAPDKFKSYQELDARFKTVIGSHTADYSETIEEEVAEPVTAAAAGATTFESESSEPNDSETMDYFKKLADQ